MKKEKKIVIELDTGTYSFDFTKRGDLTPEEEVEEALMDSLNAYPAEVVPYIVQHILLSELEKLSKKRKLFNNVLVALGIVFGMVSALFVPLVVLTFMSPGIFAYALSTIMAVGLYSLIAWAIHETSKLKSEKKSDTETYN